MGVRREKCWLKNAKKIDDSCSFLGVFPRLLFWKNPQVLVQATQGSDLLTEHLIILYPQWEKVFVSS